MPIRSGNRRDFLRGVAGVAALGPLAGLARARAQGANDKLNIGVIGTSGRGLENLKGVEGENIVAVCDIDDDLLGRASERLPRAKAFVDCRELIGMPGLDAVVISTADHTHAPAAAMALRLGKHVYCEKPLTHTVYEARTLAKLAAQARVATQMGTQIHATTNYRRVVEIVQSGSIGPVREVHVWLGGKTWSGGERPADSPPVPAGLHWDTWLGPAPDRPYSPAYVPQNWRRWWAFGNGTLGDMACHYQDLPFWALKLRHPITVEAQGPPVHPETTPPWLVVRAEFPARGDLPPVALTWYDGGKLPEKFDELKLNPKRWGSGVLFVGEKGSLVADYSRHAVHPGPEFVGFQPPPRSIPDSIGHHAEWIAACKDGRPTTCNFDYSGALTEAVLLGNVAYRVGRKIEWDADNLKAVGCPEADAFLRREYRPGWTL